MIGCLVLSCFSAGSDDLLVQLEADMKAVSVAPVVETKGNTPHIHPHQTQ